jgi:Family of unknown function (DUF6698)
MNYIPLDSCMPRLDPRAKKDQRGFHHPVTACLLCPRHLRDDFEKLSKRGWKMEECIDSANGQETQLAVLGTVVRVLYTVQ